MSVFKKLKVKKSSIIAAGTGVFANELIKKDQVIGIFTGSIVRKNGTHVLWLSEKEGILVKSVLKYINHSKNGNAILHGAILYAMKDIRIGEEIFFDYNEDEDHLF